jgi:major membrane immunogen (membrane-anchored lipoprotein)
MEALAMTVDLQESLAKMATDVAVLVERNKNTDSRNDDRFKNIEFRLGGIEKSIEGFREELGKIKKELGTYSVIAAIGVSVLVYAIKEVLAR